MKIKQTYEIVELDGDTDVLKEHPDNPRRGDVAAIDQSIEVNGWYGAVTAQKSTGYILAGNHRYRVAVQRGAKSVPVVFVDVDDETAKRILLADNRTADLGTYDEETLAALLDGLETLDGTGYGLGALEAELESENGTDAADDALPEPDDVPDDKYEPQYGVLLMVESEDTQAELYGWLQEQKSEMAGQDGMWDEMTLKVVAV